MPAFLTVLSLALSHMLPTSLLLFCVAQNSCLSVFQRLSIQHFHPHFIISLSKPALNFSAALCCPPLNPAAHQSLRTGLHPPTQAQASAPLFPCPSTPSPAPEPLKQRPSAIPCGSGWPSASSSSSLNQLSDSLSRRQPQVTPRSPASYALPCSTVSRSPYHGREGGTLNSAFLSVCRCLRLLCWVPQPPPNPLFS